MTVTAVELIQKNLQTTSIVNRGQQVNQIKNVFEFIQKAIETSTYKIVSRAVLYRDGPEGNVIHLSKYSFTKNQFKVLNENLIFCPTPGHSSKKGRN